MKKLCKDFMRNIKGGKRVVKKYDLDGDGKWDFKTVTNKERGKFKSKVRVN
jgi:hypothetical protein